MESVILIASALEYIENNLTEDVRTEDIAKELYCSKSSLEKLFRYVTNMSIHDYFVRRRMSRAAKDMIANPEASLLDLAVKYGYGSNEAFTRAFKGIWNISPSEYRKNPMHFELFPALNLDPELMEDIAMTGRKKVDISELYDYIQERKDCFIVGVDIRNLIPINDIARKAGDIAIITALSRLEQAAGDDDIVFRVGGDEFVALTDSEDEEYVKAIKERILEQNGETFDFEDKKIPLEVYVTYYKIGNENIRYSELFSKLQNEITEEKRRIETK